ncbi:hypothetical protein QC764_405410 [Podospora pseudoanserina]|uniref:Amine oxidase n=1 Tax=Podospora pseudoanserina TaxID=2609844 RepID=A0ABR0IB26_9PEZI|nr:hypothetical protein QC764_405410 [Podospora pseudoanserina]
MNLRQGLGLFIVSCHLVVKMRSTVLATVALSGFVLTLADGKGKGKGKGNDRIRTIYKDVAIIGGGASGSYSAVRLREDYNVSVVVIEKNSNLGGHVNTFIDPVTGRGFDCGVQNWIEIGGARAFFERFGVEMQPNVRSTAETVSIDFTNGEKLTNYSPPSASDRTAALQRYLEVAESFLPVLEPGWWTFPLPQDIPADLLLPFRDFVAKYNLTAAVPMFHATTGFGIHDMMGHLTVWFMRSFNVNLVRVLLGIETSIVPVSRKNQDLYDRILTSLGADALTSTTVISTEERSSRKGVTLIVRNSATGVKTRIVAKRLLYTAIPSEANTSPLDLDREERSTLGEFNYSASYVGVVSHPSLPLNKSLVNVPASAQPANWPEAIPDYPYNTRFENYADSSYFRLIAVGDQTFTAAQAKKVIEDSFDKLVEGGVVNQTSPAQGLTFHMFEPHGLVSAYVTKEKLEGGFIQRLNGLQGRRGTWYTGASWGVHLSTSLWIFTDTVLERLVGDLRG